MSKKKEVLKLLFRNLPYFLSSRLLVIYFKKIKNFPFRSFLSRFCRLTPNFFQKTPYPVSFVLSVKPLTLLFFLNPCIYIKTIILEKFLSLKFLILQKNGCFIQSILIINSKDSICIYRKNTFCPKIFVTIM